MELSDGEVSYAADDLRREGIVPDAGPGGDLTADTPDADRRQVGNHQVRLQRRQVVITEGRIHQGHMVAGQVFRPDDGRGFSANPRPVQIHGVADDLHSPREVGWISDKQAASAGVRQAHGTNLRGISAIDDRHRVG